MILIIFLTNRGKYLYRFIPFMMRYVLILFAIVFLLSCTKKNIQAYKHYVKKNPCMAVSFNADKQNTNDFYMVKTFDASGILTHLKTQLKDIEGNTYVYDYGITYASNVAKFAGRTTVYRWDFDKPPKHRHRWNLTHLSILLS